jgi:hypothetical protein
MRHRDMVLHEKLNKIWLDRNARTQRIIRAAERCAEIDAYICDESNSMQSRIEVLKNLYTVLGFNTPDIGLADVMAYIADVNG